MELVKAKYKMSGKSFYNIVQDGRKVGQLYRFWHREDSFTNGRYYWQVAIEGDRLNSRDFDTFKEARAFVMGLK